MKFKLFQIHLTEAEYNKVNAEGHNSVPKQVTKLDMSFSEDTGALAKKAMDNNWYTHVSNITADSIEKVFEVGNIGPEASKPVMEGKGLLFKIFADIDVFDI